jgi:putative membrane fusion protein
LKKQEKAKGITKEPKQAERERAGVSSDDFLTRREAKRKRNKIIVMAILALVSLYLAYTIFLLIREPTDIFTIEQGKVSLEETDLGYVIRKEQVVKGNNYKNGMEKIKSEGEKAAKGESIFRYYSKNEETLKNKIAELDVKIQEAMKNQTDLYSSDIKLLENQLDTKVEDLNKITDVSKLEEYRKEIMDIVTKKSERYGELSPAGSYLRQLKDERKKLESELNSGAEYITAPESGIVSYRVDGLEETLTPDNFSTLSKQFLENLDLKTGKIVASNDESGKIINNFNCYIATISTSKQAKEAKIGNKVKIRLPNNEEIEAQIAYLSQENEEEMLIVLQIDRQISELTNYRKISFDLIWWSYSGLKVPNEAILTENELTYVVRNRAGYLSKILVKVENQNERYSIVTNYKTEELKELGYSDQEINTYKKISVYDEILLNPNEKREILQLDDK